MNDLRTMRQRHEDAAADLDGGDAGGDELGSAAGFGVTTTLGTYPTSASSYFAIQPNDVSGAETEGTAAVYTPLTGPPVIALNTGSAVPPQGTPVVWHAVGGRRVFRYDG
jgi:hypothetical protein